MAHRSDGPALSLGRLGMGTEQCAVVVISKSWALRSMFLPISLSIIACGQSKHKERRRGNSVRQPIRGDAADGRHHCRCHLRSLEYCWLRNQPAHWRPNTQLDVDVGTPALLGHDRRCSSQGCQLTTAPSPNSTVLRRRQRL